MSEAPIHRLLVADDEESMRYFLKKSLSRLGFEVEAVESGDAAIELYEARPFDVAVLDLKMPGTDGIEVLSRIRAVNPEAVVIIMTAYGTIRSAVEAMRKGAFEYITKPFEIEELNLLIERALDQRATLRENRELRQIIDHRRAYAGLIGQSPPMRAVFQTIDLLRDSIATVLISGASGTGKELLARAIHLHSARGKGPFVPLNCAALPETLFESELFGHEAGAFTGAIKKKRGLVERAHGGTLFLDEVSEISMGMQVKLLRFLEEKMITPVGATEPVPVNLRTIAATNCNLEKQVTKGAFRQDLFWRLNVVPIDLPPLRERREDISVLATHFLDRFGKGAVRGFTVDAMIVLSSYPWPGNVRELENVVERMVVLNAGKELLDVEEIPASIRENAETPENVLTSDETQVYQDALSAFERDYLVQLFRKTKGNISQTARLAGVSRSYIHQKIKRLDIDPARFRD